MEARLTGPAPELDSQREKDFQGGIFYWNIMVFFCFNAITVISNLAANPFFATFHTGFLAV